MGQCNTQYKSLDNRRFCRGLSQPPAITPEYQKRRQISHFRRRGHARIANDQKTLLLRKERLIAWVLHRPVEPAGIFGKSARLNRLTEKPTCEDLAGFIYEVLVIGITALAEGSYIYSYQSRG